MDSTQSKKEELEAAAAFTELYRVIARLRAPGGCPWDREQTPLTLRENIIEEAYEAVEAITEGGLEHIREELGDVLLNALMVALIYQEQGAFSIAETFTALSEKLIRRHPHVFGNQENAPSVSTAEEVLAQWDKIKQDIEGRKTESLLGGVSGSLPPLARAQKMQKKAAKVGFDFPQIEGIWEKVREEAAELRVEVSSQNRDEKAQSRIEEEAGDFLFAAVNLLRRLNVNAEVALMRANKKFEQRFGYVEKALLEKGLTPEAASLEEMDALWDEAKQKGF